MTPSTGEHGASSDALGNDALAHGTSTNNQVDNDADANANGNALPSVEDMEDLILEAYNNMQSDGEHIFLPSDVASKLQYIAQLVKGAGYTSDDLVSNGSESNQEENARSLLSSDAHHTAPPSAASSAPSSPPMHHLSLTDDEAAPPPVLYLGLNDEDVAQAALEHDRKPIEPLVLENNNFVEDASTPPGPPISHHGEFGPALSPVQEIAEDLLSVSDFGSVVERPAETQAPATLTPPKQSSSSSSRQPAHHSGEKPKSMLRKPEVHRKSSVPGRPSSVTISQELNKAPSSGTRSHLTTPRVKTDSHVPPSSRERAAPTSYEQRREAAQKLKEDKEKREMQARESARKQREEARRKIEEANEKEIAAKRERVARMRMQKEQQRKGSAKAVSSTR